MHYSKRLEYCFVCFRLVLARCQDSKVFRIRKIPLSITLALLKSLEWLLRQAWAAIFEPVFFLHFRCVPFSLLKNTSSLTNVAPRKIGARNFIQNIGLKFNWRPKLEGREILLQGLGWSSNNINSILSAKKTCDGFCDITNIRDSGHGGGFIFTESNWITCPLILSDEAENVDQSSSSINENNWFVN